jgi:serine/threonine protein kinase
MKYSKTKTKTKIKTKIKTKKQKAGKPIASGGFGCVFSPALKCKNTKEVKKGTVSKLMMKEDAEEEYNDLVRFKPILQTIPNYKNYFIIDDIELCEPAVLSAQDLEDFDTKCKPLLKEGITSRTINEKKSQLLSLNMPDGGVELGEYIKTVVHKREFVEINNTMISLLKDGIKPMNDRHIYNCDMKDSNILVDRDPKGYLLTKIIDWGLSAQVKGGKIPEAIQERPIQFNLPFSLILYNPLFDKMYNDFLKQNKNPDYEATRLFVYNYIYKWIEKRGLGHMSAIDKIFLVLYGNDLKHMDPESKVLTIEFGASYHYIVNYLTTILQKYTDTKNGKLDLHEYTEKVFFKIVDIWGFLTSYLQIYELLHYSHKSANNEIICNEIKRILMDYLYKPRTEPTPLDLLEKDLRNLNPLFEKMDWNEKSRRVSEKNMRAGRKNKTNKKTRKANISKWVKGPVHLKIIHDKGIYSHTTKVQTK